MTSPRPNSASLLITENCNLSCKYCFEKHNKQEMTKDVAIQAVDFLVQNAVDDGLDFFHTMLFGGEPMLVPSVVRTVLERGVEQAQKHNLHFSAGIITNATLMDDEIAGLLYEFRDTADLTVQLSVDGIREAHNMYRVTKGGEGSFDLVEKNIPVYKEIFKDKPLNLNIHGCINKKSLPYLYDNYVFFRDVWGLERVWFLPIAEEKWDESDVELYREQNQRIYDHIMERVRKEKSLDEVKFYSPFDRCLGTQSSLRTSPCGAGKTFVTIAANGEIYPCHQIYFNDPDKDSLIGDIWSGIDDDKRRLYLEYDGADLTCDKDCDHGNCFRCLASNWVERGSIFSQTKGIYCKLSHIDRYFQNTIREELIEMGLLNGRVDNNGNSDCSCNTRGSSYPCGIVSIEGKSLDMNKEVDRLEFERLMGIKGLANTKHEYSSSRKIEHCSDQEEILGDAGENINHNHVKNSEGILKGIRQDAVDIPAPKTARTNVDEAIEVFAESLKIIIEKLNTIEKKL